MPESTLSREDAQELLTTLSLVGEGWWRQVALAIKMDAHKSLGMSRRAFTDLIGQRLTNPREAIIELHKEGLSRGAIADVLHVDRDKSVTPVLIEAGLVEKPDSKSTGGQAAGRSRRNAESRGFAGGQAADAELEKLRNELAKEQAKVEKAEKLAEEAREARAAVEKASKDEVDSRAAEAVKKAKAAEKRAKDERAKAKEQQDTFAKRVGERVQEITESRMSEAQRLEERQEEWNEADEEVPHHIIRWQMDASITYIEVHLESLAETVSKLAQMAPESEDLGRFRTALNKFQEELTVYEAMAGLPKEQI